MIDLYHPWNPSSINDKLDGKVILPYNNDVGDYLYDHLHKINSDEMHMNNDNSDRENYDMVTWINNQRQWKLCPLNTT